MEKEIEIIKDKELTEDLEKELCEQCRGDK